MKLFHGDNLILKFCSKFSGKFSWRGKFSLRQVFLEGLSLLQFKSPLQCPDQLLESPGFWVACSLAVHLAG